METHVKEREFWIVPWDWTREFPIKVGEHHNYRNIRRYPLPKTGISPMPKVEYTYAIPKGYLHFTEGVNPALFV